MPEMKTRLAIVLVAFMVLTMGACCSTIDKKAILDIESTHNLVLPAYVGYVDKDPSLTKDQKDDRKKLVDSLKRLVEALKKSVE